TLGGAGSTALCRNGSNQIASCTANANGVTLQQAYDASADPEITLDATRGALTLRDASTPLAANLFEVQNNAGNANYFAVTATGISTSQNLTVSGTSTLTGDVGTTGNFSQTGAHTFGTGTGAVSLNGDTTIAANKNLTL